MTEMWRGAKKRLNRPIRAGSPTCCFKSLTKSAFVALRAGPKLKRTVAIKQKRKVTATIEKFGLKSSTKEKLKLLLNREPSEWSRKLLDHTLRRSPTTPPQSARSSPSQRS